MGKNAFRVSIDSLESSEAQALQNKLQTHGYDLEISISRVYTINHDLSADQLKTVADALTDPITETHRTDAAYDGTCDYALELGFLPGVTDNVGHTATEIIEDLFKTKLGQEKVFTSKVLFLTSKSGKLTEEDVTQIALILINPLIERYHIKSGEQYKADGGMDTIVPVVKLNEEPKVTDVDLDVSEEELLLLGKKGILDPDTNQRRGPLALSKPYLLAIKEYFAKEGRKPTDIEIESIAQTWSEHCKHTIFASPVDDIPKGIFKSYIKAATEKVRSDLGKDDFCLSVFGDNAGGIVFDDTYLVADKAETHNSPCALDPFGGAVTGIVGVNRDIMGFGLGALPIANKYGFCVGRPEDVDLLYRGKEKSNPALLPRRILDGVVQGVNVGGNQSGIPTPHGVVYFDDSYKGKPLIFVGTIGLMPRKLADGRESYEKQAQVGDNIVVIGGRVGKDGIHGATFSSEALDEGSPSTAVQIGDPITQKKLSDAIVKEARDLGLYNSITDNGAGGISCSVAEMAKECGGFELDLEKVPLKYPGLQPWETWISESQERMTLSIPDTSLDAFMDLMKQRGVSAWVVGTFNDSGRAVVTFKGKEIFNLDMDFLHEGLPETPLVTEPYPYKADVPEITVTNQLEIFEKILGAHNNCSHEYISRQYDHNVQNMSVIGPLIGKGRVNGSASVIKPIFDSPKGVVMSQTLYPRLSEVSCYAMAACAIDTAIRNAVAVGGDVNHMALMDNFCWCSSTDPKRLGQLKDTAKACYDYAVAYKTPFISGKDSMFNDFQGFDADSTEVKISALPTLFMSSMGVLDNVRSTATLDFKVPGDLVYVIGKTKNECGGSELYNACGVEGGVAPTVDADAARKLYETMYTVHQEGLMSSCASVAQGGFLIALAKMAIGGQMGCFIDVAKMPVAEGDKALAPEQLLYSETQSRFIVTIDPKNKEAFEKAMDGFAVAAVGVVGEDDSFVVAHGDDSDALIETDVKKLDEVYKKRFKDY